MRELTLDEVELIGGGDINWGSVYSSAAAGVIGGAIAGAVGGPGGMGLGAIGGGVAGGLGSLFQQMSQ